MFGTLQDRLIKELARAGITEIAAANQWIREVYLPDHNARFGKRPLLEESAFVPVTDPAALAEILSIEQERIVARDNTVTYDSRSLQLPESRVRAHYVKAASRSANTPTACSPCSTGRGCWRATTPIVNPSKENESVRRPPRDPLRRGELEPCGFVDSRFAPAHKLHKANSRSKPKRTNDVPRKPVNSECYRQREAGRAPAGCVLSRDGRRSM